MDAVTYRYDDHGNLVEKSTPEQTLLFEYDLDNQLSRVADQHNATIATYGYDALRRRIWKEVHGQRTYFHYSDQGLIAELNEAGTLLKSYGYKPGSPWGTDPLYVREGGRNHWYLTDHLGTPQQVVAENGAVVWQAQYAVFGKAEVDAGSTITSNLRFPGQYYDAETGLHYNWNRYYDPEARRYTQTDPIGFEGGDLNLYVYAKNAPNKFIDYDGNKGKLPDQCPDGVRIPDRFKAPDNYYGDKGEYCEDTYEKMIFECSFPPTPTTGLCLDRARHWYTMCVAWSCNMEIL